jgi:hypothetical protein
MIALIDLVDSVVERNLEICAHCNQLRGDHAHLGEWCPLPGLLGFSSSRRYFPAVCEHENDGFGCRRSVAGVDLETESYVCLEHFPR